MGGTLGTASFRGDDPDCLVAASLACPVCLGSGVRWSLGGDSYDPLVDCACEDCGWSWTVFLSADQALRLSLHERRALDPARSYDHPLTAP